MKKRFFITSSGCDVDETSVTVGLLEATQRASLRSVGLKPITIDAVSDIDGAIRAESALRIQAASTLKIPYEQVNPIAFKHRFSPYLASQEEGRLVTVSRLEGYMKGALLAPHDIALVEGLSGWREPLNDRECLSDMAKVLGFPVILIVKLSPHCLNSAVLTAEAILRDGLTLRGWVAIMEGEDDIFFQHTVNTLSSMLPAPLLGVLPWSRSDQSLDIEFDTLLSILLAD